MIFFITKSSFNDGTKFGAKLLPRNPKMNFILKIVFEYSDNGVVVSCLRDRSTFNYQQMQKIVLVLITLLGASTLGLAQKSRLKSGPMLGYVEMREALLWAQTTEAATVHFEYWPVDKPKERHKTERIKTEKATGFTAHCVADQVEPGITYAYELRINKKRVALPYPTTFKTQPLWQWRSDPPAFTMLAGSCNYVNDAPYDRPGKPYGSEHQIFTSMAKQNADIMLWLGDNTYLREPDWSTRTGVIHRYTNDRSLPEMQPFLASTAHYAVWDDHDYGPNDSDRSWVHAPMSLEVFKMFWGNPTYGVAGQPSCATQFKYMDVDFFLLDNRTFRSPNYCDVCPEKTQLGAEQREWLLDALAASTAPFKIVALGGQLLSTNEGAEAYKHYHAAERDTILNRIEREGVKNVIFINGDRHFAEMSQLTNSKGNVLYELTTSPLTSGAYKECEKEKNEHRIAGTLFGGHNFAALRFSGPRTARVLDITLYGTDGQEIWKKSIASQSQK
jgi:alkaline phosphatase D